MISISSNIIAKLPQNRVLVLKENTPGQRSPEAEQIIQQLRKRDQEVRTHESGHSRNPLVSALGAPRYHYEIGPDGKAYATGGEVTVSTGGARDAKSALLKAQALKEAAISGEPSSQDLEASGAAKSMEAEALSKLAKESENKIAPGKTNSMEFSAYNKISSLVKTINQNPDLLSRDKGLISFEGYG